jgi:hypothetical protein
VYRAVLELRAKGGAPKLMCCVADCFGHERIIKGTRVEFERLCLSLCVKIRDGSA